MQNIFTLPVMVADTMRSYVTESFNAKLLYTEDASTGTYSVLVVPNDANQAPHVMLLVRIAGDQITIITDTTDRPLEEALVQAGIPRQQIIVPRREAASLRCLPRLRLFS